MSALSTSGIAFYALILIGAFAVRSAAGFGAGLIAIPMLALILPVSTAVSVASIFITLTSVQHVSFEWRQVAWRQFLLIFSYSMVGIGLGLYFIKLLNEDLRRHCLGVFMILYSLQALRSADTAFYLPTRWHGAVGAGVGIVGGLCSALFGAGAGPIYVVYFDILRLEKAVFRATMSAVVVLGGMARIAGYQSDGFYGSSTLGLVAVGLPLVVIGSWLGDKIVNRLSARSFSQVVAGIMLLSGITLLLR